MPVSHLFSTWRRIWRHQRLLWWLLAAQAVLTLFLVTLIQTLDLVTLQTDVRGGTSLGSAVYWQLVFGSGALVGVLLFGLATTWLSVAIIRLVDLAYPQPEKPITWSQVYQGLWKRWLRWLGAAVLMGMLIGAVVTLVFMTLGFLGLGGSIAAETGEPAGTVLAVLLFSLFFLGICAFLPLIWLVITPFLTGVSMAVVMEPLPWPIAVERGLRIVRKWFLWWVLLVALYLALSFIANLFGLPFSLAYALLQFAVTEGTLPPWTMAVIGWPLNAFSTLIALVVSLLAFTWFAVFYRYLSEQWWRTAHTRTPAVSSTEVSSEAEPPAEAGTVPPPTSQITWSTHQDDTTLSEPQDPTYS